MSCEGENPADIENVGTGIHYYPLGFSGEYFPFTNVPGYLSPIVAVYFEEPTRNYLKIYTTTGLILIAFRWCSDQH